MSLPLIGAERGLPLSTLSAPMITGYGSDRETPPFTTMRDPRGLFDHRDEVRRVIVEGSLSLIDEAPVPKTYLLLA